MKAIEVARQVLDTGTCHYFRDTEGQYEARPYHEFADPLTEREEARGEEQPEALRGWIALDLFSASGLVQVYDALRPENRAKLEEYPLTGMVLLAFKCINSSREGIPA